jgi:hypothetical protein
VGRGAEAAVTAAGATRNYRLPASGARSPPGNGEVPGTKAARWPLVCCWPEIMKGEACLYGCASTTASRSVRPFPRLTSSVVVCPDEYCGWRRRGGYCPRGGEALGSIDRPFERRIS